MERWGGRGPPLAPRSSRNHCLPAGADDGPPVAHSPMSPGTRPALEATPRHTLTSPSGGEESMTTGAPWVDGFPATWDILTQCGREDKVISLHSGASPSLALWATRADQE